MRKPWTRTRSLRGHEAWTRSLRLEHEALAHACKDWDIRTRDAVQLYWGGSTLRLSKIYLAAVVVDHPQEYQELADPWWRSAIMAGLTLRDLLLITMNQSINVQNTTCSSMHFGWCRISVCFRCICVIPCIKSTMALLFMSYVEYCVSYMDGNNLY